MTNYGTKVIHLSRMNKENQYYFEGFGDGEAFNIRKNAYGIGGMSK